ncbi:glycosyltransferase family 2 protein [Brevundimonas sp. VNH65]|uniref:glycosyltransferase family 2 protein n=1 Tax=Brevundimonas sp. VNH65 TaxID=3400917 RepID=UPI003C044E62
MTGPRLSIVVVGHDMARELPRTVRSLLPPYQQGVAPGEVEIFVMDSRSTPPVDPAWFADLPGVQVRRVDSGGLSPCLAVNLGVACSRAPLVAVAIDGARMASPGLVRASLEALAVAPDAIVATLGFHLGPKVQQVSVTEGYDRDEEDRLLAGINWPSDGYRLFEICALGESYAQGAFEAPPETTFFVMSRARFTALGGFDEGFRSLGGGFANYDFFDRATSDPDKPLVMLVGEGTFHQLHYGATTQAGGVARQVGDEGALWDQYASEYERLRGRPYRRAHPPVRLYGAVTHPKARALFFPPETSA